MTTTGTNILSYSSFESGATALSGADWGFCTAAFDTAHAYPGAGLTALKAITTGNFGSYVSPGNQITYQAAVATNTAYVASAWVYTTASSVTCRALVGEFDSGHTYITNLGPSLITLTANAWTQVVTTFTTGSTTAYVGMTFEFATPVTGTSLWFDAAKIELGSTPSAWSPGPNDPATALADTGTGADTFSRTEVGNTWLSGVGGAADIAAFGTWRGRPVQVATTWDDTNAAMVQSWAFQSGGLLENWTNPVSIAVGGFEAPETWAQAAAGNFDSRWTTCLTNMRDLRAGKSGTIYIRPFHEMNGNWFAWSVYSGDEANFVTAWRRFRALQQSIYPASKLNFCPNNGSAQLDWRTYWPGNAYVDVVGTDYYNEWPTVTDAASWTAALTLTTIGGAPQGLQTWLDFAASVGKPFVIDEWAGKVNAGDNPAFIQGMHDFFAANGGVTSGKLLYETYFDTGDNFAIYPTTGQPATAAKYQELWTADIGTKALADTGAGVDALTIPAKGITLADTGTGADTFSRTTATPIAVPAIILPTLVPTSRGPVVSSGGLDDTGTGTDALSLGTTKVLTDVGTAADAFTPDFSGTFGSGTFGSGTFGGVLLVALSDTATGVDAWGTPKPLTDTGVGVDALRRDTARSLTDTGGGVDVLFTDNSRALSDIGTGFDSITVPSSLPTPTPDGGPPTLSPLLAYSKHTARRTDWQLFARAPDLTRAALLDDVVKCEFVRRNRAVSTWVLNVPPDGPAAQIQPGWGLIITRDGVLELSGPVSKIDRTSQADTDTLTLSGVDDTCVLADRLAMPQPATAPAGATDDYDVRTGLGSTVLAGYVNANAGSGAVIARRVTGLSMAPDPMVGATVTGQARFDVLLELCRSLALQAGICFQIVQVDNALQFLTWAPADRTELAVFSRELGNLGDFAWTAAAPTANAVLVAGGGDLHARVIEERLDAGSATLWGRRVEMLRDRRDTVVTGEMDASGDEELAKGAAVSSLALTPVQTDWLRYGTHYNIGDLVTAVVGGVRTVQTVQEVTVSLTADGEVITPAIGSPDATPATTSGIVARLLAEQKSLRIRIRNLERI